MPKLCKTSQTSWYARNKDKQIAKQRAWRKSNPEESRKRSRAYHLKSRFGLTVEQWEKMFDEQGRACAICRSTQANHFRGWNVDHDHDTNMVRRILCHHCNLLLGNARDNPAILSAAIEYLKAFENGGQKEETS